MKSSVKYGQQFHNGCTRSCVTIRKHHRILTNNYISTKNDNGTMGTDVTLRLRKTATATVRPQVKRFS